jgi:hypothetical protein
LTFQPNHFKCPPHVGFEQITDAADRYLEHPLLEMVNPLRVVGHRRLFLKRLPFSTFRRSSLPLCFAKLPGDRPLR